MNKIKGRLTSSHWGVGVVTAEEGKLVSVDPHPADPDASAINENIVSSLNGNARVRRPAVRRSWLEHGPGHTDVKRGCDEFIEMGWEEVLAILSKELQRVRDQFGNEAIFAGSYGWSSAGRFHHAQSQLKRFLNTFGGFSRSEGNYSYNAALVLMPHIVGDFREHIVQATRWSVIAKHTKLVVLFGGMAARNMQVSDGGVSRHRSKDSLEHCADSGVRFINISPLRSDTLDTLNAQWLPLNPGSDTAVMMGLAHTLLTEQLHDTEFLDTYTVGFDKFEAYLLGHSDGVIKTVEWAEAQSGIDAQQLKQLAREMASGRTMISTAAGVQRTDYGEQPLWMTITLACMLGQIGLPGGGYSIGYGVNGNVGNIERLFGAGTLPQGKNLVSTYIPVAMISEMLLNPGARYRYNGKHLTFPDTKLLWWAGGNPFHHHQDLNRLHEAFQQPDTIIVNEMNWTSTARHADIVLPVAAPQERTDFGAGKSDDALVPMTMHARAPGEAKSEYDIYCMLADKLGCLAEFSEGRNAEQWLTHLWEETRQNGKAFGVSLPDWQTFLQGDMLSMQDPAPGRVFMATYRADPVANPLPTPSGKFELYSEVIASFALDDCPGHASWFPPRDLANGKVLTHPLYLLSGQPLTRLHSQLDNGEFSLRHKIHGREPMLIHPDDAASRGISDGDVVELFNQRGRCLAGAKVSDEILQGCVFLWTGAWYDPDYTAPANRDRHGNPNVLTHDLRTSSLSQSSAAHSAMIQVQLYVGAVPEITVHNPPLFSH